MRIGIIVLPDQRWRVLSERWRRAEEYGFDHAWTYDHLGWRDLVDGPWFDAVPTLTAAALVTSRIRLGTMVASPNFRHPVHFAREITALDDVSGGRITIGIGAGGFGFDAAVLGRPALSLRQRADRFIEFVELLDLLLRKDRVTWQGEHYSAVDARNTPGCVQLPRVPFVLAGNGPRAVALAARLGQGWVTNGGAEPGTDQAGWWRSTAEMAARFADTGSSADRYLVLDSAPIFSMSSAEHFADSVGRAAELGFTDVLTHWPRESSWYAGSESVLESVAAALPALRTQ
ncbi:luciferase [Rhizocola hellebori]|uniref:Luciferase n=1 Tax=Rhizocola hellebori TaxID=1392758 RepID=A0A8J3QLC7_9ACTN|nr:LLM class flavin-dependent oxidoreductase [Rhizocola hellebori]GIH11543.1 luciferase [Rhizocola hellebori]